MPGKNGTVPKSYGGWTDVATMGGNVNDVLIDNSELQGVSPSKGIDSGFDTKKVMSGPEFAARFYGIRRGQRGFMTTADADKIVNSYDKYLGRFIDHNFDFAEIEKRALELNGRKFKNEDEQFQESMKTRKQMMDLRLAAIDDFKLKDVALQAFDKALQKNPKWVVANMVPFGLALQALAKKGGTTFDEMIAKMMPGEGQAGGNGQVAPTNGQGPTAGGFGGDMMRGALSMPGASTAMNAMSRFMPQPQSQPVPTNGQAAPTNGQGNYFLNPVGQQGSPQPQSAPMPGAGPVGPTPAGPAPMPTAPMAQQQPQAAGIPQVRIAQNPQTGEEIPMQLNPATGKWEPVGR